MKLYSRYSECRVLEPFDIDVYGKIKLSRLLSFMQVSADHHADKISVFDGLKEKNLVWVIARMRVDLSCCPVYGDELEIETWTGFPDRLVFPRYFNFKIAGKSIGNATSQYVLLDHINNKMIPPKSITEFYNSDSSSVKALPQPVRVRFSTEKEPICHRTPLFSDIDFNGHMNNAKYADWVLDLYSTAQHKDRFVNSFNMNFISDGLEGKEIAIYKEDNIVSNESLVKGDDSKTGKPVFSCLVSWKNL
jgi:medium-chain acyl-[acyl-carrier-protein] hydrolase